MTNTCAATRYSAQFPIRVSSQFHHHHLPNYFCLSEKSRISRAMEHRCISNISSRVSSETQGATARNEYNRKVIVSPFKVSRTWNIFAQIDATVRGESATGSVVLRGRC